MDGVRMNMFRSAVATIALLAVTSCHHETKLPVAVTPTDAECAAFAREFGEAINKPNPQHASMMIDWDGLVEMSTADAGTDVSSTFQKAFAKGAKREAGRGVFAQQLTNVLKEGGHFDHLRNRTVGGEKSALFRLILADGSVNYYEFSLKKDPTGRVVASDIFIYMAAEKLSKTMHRLYQMTVAQQPDVLERLQGKKSPILEHLNEYRQMAEASRRGDYASTMKLYGQLPPELQNDKTSMLIYVQAASKSSNEEYAAAIEKFRKAYPNDASVDLVSIDGYIMAEKWDQAFAALANVDRAVGGDPYIEVIGSNMEMMRGDVAAARRRAENAAQREPTLTDAYWALINVSLREKKYDETAKWLRHLRDDLHQQLGDLSAVPDYAEFLASAEGRAFVVR